VLVHARSVEPDRGLRRVVVTRRRIRQLDLDARRVQLARDRVRACSRFEQLVTKRQVLLPERVDVEIVLGRRLLGLAVLGLFRLLRVLRIPTTTAAFVLVFVFVLVGGRGGWRGF